MGSNEFQQVLTEFILEHKENVYRLAYSYVRNPQNALDIVQESIQKALAKGGSLQKPESIKSWFYRIVVNTALDFLRRGNKVKWVDEEILESHGYLDQAPDRYLDLEHAMAELPVIYREVIVLRFFEEWKIEEIATILELPVSTVKSRLYHALKLLRINLEE